jgi:hypothetical protein
MIKNESIEENLNFDFLNILHSKKKIKISGGITCQAEIIVTTTMISIKKTKNNNKKLGT